MTHVHPCTESDVLHSGKGHSDSPLAACYETNLPGSLDFLREWYELRLVLCVEHCPVAPERAQKLQQHHCEMTTPLRESMQSFCVKARLMVIQARELDLSPKHSKKDNFSKLTFHIRHP